MHVRAFIYIKCKVTLHSGGSGNTDTVSRLVDTVGEGEDGMNWERSVETHTHTHNRDFTRNSLVELL